MSAVGGSGRDRAIEAAAEAIAEHYEHASSIYRADARRALEAALPVLLNDLADSIEAQQPESGDHILMTARRQGLIDAYADAARLVRAAAAGWGEA